MKNQKNDLGLTKKVKNNLKILKNKLKIKKIPSSKYIFEFVND